MKLKIVLEASEEGGYTVYVPSLPGCISEGDTKEDALTNIKEAIELYMEPVEDDITISPGREIKAINRSKSYLAAEAIENYVNDQQWQIDAIAKGIKEADEDRFVTDRKLRDTLTKWGVD
jgi:predicted RNase H-like HicB family nuclease